MKTLSLRIYKLKNEHLFFSIFIFCFLYKLCFGWKIGISQGWQDEIQWRLIAKRSTFLHQLFTPDAGYFTPALRLLAYLFSLHTSSNFLLWHLLVLTGISFSVASIAFAKFLTENQKLLVAAIVCTYPSFDLLLLHNLSYWFAIPTFVLLINILIVNDATIFHKWQVVLPGLVILCSKPQIILSLVPIIFLAFIKKRLNRSLFQLIVIEVLLLLVTSHTNSGAIKPDLDFASAILLIVTFHAHFVIAFTSLLTLVVYAIAHYSHQIWFTGVYLIGASSIGLFSTLRIKGGSSRLYALKLSLLIYAGSLYFFANSGWSNNDLINSDIYTSLFSRHYLPVIFLSVTYILILFSNRRWVVHILIFALSQNIFLQILLFNRFYAPV